MIKFQLCNTLLFWHIKNYNLAAESLEVASQAFKDFVQPGGFRQCVPAVKNQKNIVGDLLELFFSPFLALPWMCVLLTPKLRGACG